MPQAYFAAENLDLEGRPHATNRVVLAPMSGVTDAPFRNAALRAGAGLVVSEMIASRQLVCEANDELRRLRKASEGVHVVQIAGCEAEWMRLAAKMAEDAGADVIDINMGCPAKKVINAYSGSALMRDLGRAEELIEATLEGTSQPVTLKMRLGWDWDQVNAPELAQRAERLGVKLVTVHGRTRNQFYKGEAQWQPVLDVKSACTIPVIVNGDITSPEKAEEALRLSGADAVMVGRASLGQPWLLGQIADSLKGGTPRKAPQGVELAAFVIAHAEDAIAHYEKGLGIRVFRKHLSAYVDLNTPQGEVAKWRQKLMQEADEAALFNAIKDWGQSLENHSLKEAA